jgi:acyl-CoA synthetase (AMP-forming)/AMP-acid ligase II
MSPFRVTLTGYGSPGHGRESLIVTLQSTDDLWMLLEMRAAATPDLVLAMDAEGGTLTAGTWKLRAERVAAGLHARGVRAGTVVSWQLPNRFDSFVLTSALSRLGVVQNPLVPILREREVGFICRQTGAAMLIAPSTFRGFDHAAMAHAIAAETPLDVLVADQLPELDAGDLPPYDPDGSGHEPVRWLFYTSGTTADPKGARHPDRSFVAAARGFEDALEVTAGDRVMFVAPITHVGGIALLTSSLRTGLCNVLIETFTVPATIEWLRAAGTTLIGMGTPLFTAYLAHQRAHPELAPLFPSARAFISGGAPTPPALHHEMKAELGTVGIVSGWGLTECPMLAWSSITDTDEQLAFTNGRAVAGASVVAVLADGTVAAPGVEGELRATGRQMMLGYVDPALDAEAFDAQGRLRTGDLGTVDADGYVRITGRLKDIIIRNMENISALELEQLLFTHPGVQDVAVLGVPDARTGERAAVVVVPADAGDPPTLDELCHHLRTAGLSDRKLPELLAYSTELPRNAMQKVVKAELRPLFVTG